MRTRFLHVDYFALENEFFHRFPIPSPRFFKPLSTVGDLLCFDFVPEISLGIDWLTIDSAVSKFFDDVLPRRIDVDNGYRGAGGESLRFLGSSGGFSLRRVLKLDSWSKELLCRCDVVTMAEKPKHRGMCLNTLP